MCLWNIRTLNNVKITSFLLFVLVVPAQCVIWKSCRTMKPDGPRCSYLWLRCAAVAPARSDMARHCAPQHPPGQHRAGPRTEHTHTQQLSLNCFIPRSRFLQSFPSNCSCRRIDSRNLRRPTSCCCSSIRLRGLGDDVISQFHVRQQVSNISHTPRLHHEPEVSVPVSLSPLNNSKLLGMIHNYILINS